MPTVPVAACPTPGTLTRFVRRLVAILLQPHWLVMQRVGYVSTRPRPGYPGTFPPGAESTVCWQLVAAWRYGALLVPAAAARTISAITRRPWQVTITCPIDSDIDEDDDVLREAAQTEIIQGLLAPATRLVMRIAETPGCDWPHRHVASAPIETVSVTDHPARRNPGGTRLRTQSEVTVTATLIVAGRDLFHPRGYACPETPDAPRLLERSLAEVPTYAKGSRAYSADARIRRRLAPRPGTRAPESLSRP